MASTGITVLSLLLTAASVPAQQAEDVVRELLAGFNAHDPEAMGEQVADDVEVFYVDEDGVAELGTRGRVQLVEQMTEYFRSLPRIRSEVEALIPGPVYVAFRERIVGGSASLAVYEVREGLIQRVWYYPVDSP